MTKFYKWTVEIAIAETWVEDGFDITDESLHDMMCGVLGYATSTEIRCRVIKRPARQLINKAQGADARRAREDWPDKKYEEALCFIVTSVDDLGGQASYGRALVFGHKLGAAPGARTQLLGLEPDEYVVEVGDIVTIETTTIDNIARDVVRCVNFSKQKYPEYDTRSTSLTRSTNGIIEGKKS